MGAARRHPRGLRDRDRLHEIVRQLVELGVIGEPEQWPTYVKVPPRPGMGQGWVWKPAGEPRRMLGSNAYLAHAHLLKLFPDDDAA
jgi:hypothetical protein